MEEVKQLWCEEDQKYYPTIVERNGTMYELDPKTWTYNEMVTINYTEEEQELLKNPIRRYGRAWQKFMEENYPYMIAPLQMQARYGIIARQVDKEAEEMAWNLSQKYLETHPRPTTFLETAQWEKMKQLEIDNIVMTEVVLKVRE